jgi:hypothetical protein
VRYALSPYIKETNFVFKGLIIFHTAIVSNWSLTLTLLSDPSVTFTDGTTDLMCMVHIAETPSYSL